MSDDGGPAGSIIRPWRARPGMLPSDRQYGTRKATSSHRGSGPPLRATAVAAIAVAAPPKLLANTCVVQSASVERRAHTVVSHHNSPLRLCYADTLPTLAKRVCAVESSSPRLVNTHGHDGIIDRGSPPYAPLPAQNPCGHTCVAVRWPPSLKLSSS